MKNALLLLAGLALAVTLGPCWAASPQLFKGQLEVVNTRAPEFPPPEQTLLPAQPSPSLNRTSRQAGSMAPVGGSMRSGMESPIPGPEIASAPEMNSTGVTWINSPPLTMSSLRGKVVLIDFWEYTCINCIRTFPTNKKWWNRYHRYGFEIIGVHDPEFNIAYSVVNVQRAVKRFALPYPVVVDDRFEIWNLYHSDSWPNRFLIDANGVIRYHRVGEGGDSAFEHAIQKLLQAAHPGLKFPASYTIPPEQNAFAPSCGIPTSEMYVGNWYGRGVLANPQGYHDGKTIDYQLPGSVADGRVALSGEWKTSKDGMTYRGRAKRQGSTPGKLVMQYHARELYSVMNVAYGHPERLYITQDGKDLTQANKGVDVRFDAQGHSYVEVREPRMYYLIQNPSFGSHTVTLRPSAPGITVNSFTFGNNCQTAFAHL
ncbi:MAG: redoxin domain-containing protein [Terriglobia bacterium]